MGLLTSLFSAPQRRSIENPSTPLSAPDDWLYDALGAHRASSGVNVNRETALTYAAVWRAVNLIGKDVAKLPLHVYRSKRGVKYRDFSHPSYYILRRKANAEMTSFMFKLCMTMHVLVDGNAYAYIDRDGEANPLELIVLQPQRTYPVRANKRLYYITELTTGEPRRLLPENVLHLKGLSYDGLIGYNVISKARESIGRGMAEDTYGSVFFRNGAYPGVIIRHPARLSPEARKNLRESWERMHSGLENSHKTAILEEGMMADKMSFSPEDAQLLESRKWSKQEVADWFGLPPHKLGLLDGQAYNSLEQENQAYLDSAIDPWLVTWEEECDDKLLTERQKAKDSHHIEFHRRSLVRMDAAARSVFYHNAITDGWMNKDEVRSEESLNPIPDGDGQRYYVPLNMVPAGGNPDGDETPGPSPDAIPATLIEVPDVRQPDHYSCGACAAMSVGRYFGVGPDSLDDWKAALGTDVQQSTKPWRIAEYLSSLGLVVTARQNMTLDDLRRCWRAGHPVICCVQDYGPFIPDAAQFDYGHYLTVIGLSLGYVFCQDSSQDNVALPEYGDDAAPGRVMITEETWLKNWHDTDIDGNRYLQFGIAVGTELLPELPAEEDEDLDTPDDEAEGKPGEQIAPTDQKEIPTDPDGPLSGEKPRAALLAAHQRLIGDIVVRMCRRIGEQARKAAKEPKTFLGWLDTLAAKHQRTIEEAFAPAIDAFNAVTGRSITPTDAAAALLADLHSDLLQASGIYTADGFAHGVDCRMSIAESGDADLPTIKALFQE